MTVPTLTGVELAGDASRPLLVVGPSLGTTAAGLWTPAATLLGEHFHVVGWDLPGHGGTPVGEAFTMAELAAGVLAFVRGFVPDREEPRFWYAGDSVGGAVGLQLLLDAPTSVESAVLLCTGARIGDAEMWHERAASVRASGTPSLVSSSAQRWFAPGFLDREPATGSAMLHTLSDTDDEGYAQVCEALAVFDVRDRLGEIDAPVLAIAGAKDVATPPAGLEAIADGVAGASYVMLGEVAHLAPVEASSTVAALLRGHLEGRPSDRSRDRDAYDRGMAVRREVLGAEHVDRATAGADDLTRPFQDLITRYAWGDVWGRPGIDRRSRSMVTLALLAALGHDGELAMHVRAALGNGLSREEISEVLLHTGVYAGVPVTNKALAVMRQVFADLDA